MVRGGAAATLFEDPLWNFKRGGAGGARPLWPSLKTLYGISKGGRAPPPPAPPPPESASDSRVWKTDLGGVDLFGKRWAFSEHAEPYVVHQGPIQYGPSLKYLKSKKRNRHPKSLSTACLHSLSFCTKKEFPIL